MGVSSHAHQASLASGKTLVLASQSPRRLQLLQQLGFDPVCLPADVDESRLENEPAEQMIIRLSHLKAEACQQLHNFQALSEGGGSLYILAADTVIELDGEVLGKPADENEGLSMLLRLSNREHRVLSGVCLHTPSGKPQSLLVSTSVKFTTIDAQIARRYWASGEPQGKAGCYAIQGIGAKFVEHIEGSYSNVVGLPLFETSRLLESAGFTSI